MDDDELQRIREKRFEERKRDLTEKAMKASAPAAKPAAKVLILDERQFAAAVRDHPFLVVDFWSRRCPPCSMIAPIIEELSAEFAGKIRFGKLDTDANPWIARQYGITLIPTLLLFAGGQLLKEKIIGAYPKPMLRDRILRAFGMAG